ncbi:MAG: type III-B CRISPR module-associated protein Cmr5 [Limnochordaceae bacterium]|nr:type III-B CRISPR module-associated protein Cmr5 [Limnochordaceae bacterium]
MSAQQPQAGLDVGAVTRTRQQEWAQRAYEAVQRRQRSGAGSEYATICKGFAALIHHSGLCQALAFAEAKSGGAGGRSEMGQYLDDLARVLGQERQQLITSSRSADVLAYQRLSRDALLAATWLKRYAEALLDKVNDDENSSNGGGRAVHV